MVAPAILTAGMRRSIFRAAIPNFLRQGLSVRAMRRQATSWGISYRWTDMLFDVREFEGRFVKEASVRRVPHNWVIPRSAMTETDLKGVRRYRVWADERFTNKFTGQEGRELVSFYDDELCTGEDWEGKYKEKEKDDPSDPTKINRRLELRYVEHQKGTPY